MVQKSSIHADVTITETDHVVVLFTCTYTNCDRFVVAGILVEEPVAALIGAKEP